MKIGIVGNGSDKFTEIGESRARNLICEIVEAYPDATFVSGASPMEGIDIWMEEITYGYDKEPDIKEPKQHQWNAEYGYKQRNLDIADSDVVVVIVVNHYPLEYTGQRFPCCYHCQTNNHVKSGACWTAKQALRKGHQAKWFIIHNY